jgi:hypothetical protein
MSGSRRVWLQVGGRHFRDLLMMMYWRRSVGGIVRRLGADWLGFRSIDAIDRVDGWGSKRRRNNAAGGGRGIGVPLLQDKDPHQECD